ncbi:hypothetical protein QM797_13220 [Rhodococcus sp. IEGM 1381]|uniref:hypothetical protein n=1 Tax=Rhodococcus sp. IEGM 1381 TaxID=3047085 RepID=UPI0024B699C9|nr:hypothetical protein [Rhodococcus sp. IEGM 1381]MDI9895680.1 hypothetical protein [Rhodococcus sp. IEGM 1381]
MSSNIEYATVTMGLRAPRVAVIFRSESDWEYFARMAMRSANNTWGGAGFVLVPAVAGPLDGRLRDALVAYDPDYVVVSGYTVGDVDNLTPGTIARILDEQGIVEAEDRSRLAGDLRVEIVDDAILSETRDWLVDQCSSYRMSSGSESSHERPWHERERVLPTIESSVLSSRSSALTSMNEVRRPSDPMPMAASPFLEGDLGVAVAMRLGQLETPKKGLSPLGEKERTAILRWLFRAEGRHPSVVPDAALDPGRGIANGLPSAWDATSTGLKTVGRGSSRRIRNLCVVGDSPSDFALAMIWDRLYGGGKWIPKSMLDGGDHDLILRLLRDSITPPLSSSGRGAMVTSISYDIEEVADFRDEVLRVSSSFSLSDAADGLPWKILPVVGLDKILEFDRYGMRHLGVHEQFSSTTVMPVIRDIHGTTTIAATPPLPIVQDDRLQLVSDLSVQINLDVADTPIPPARYMPSDVLLHRDENPHDTWIRVARDGLSYESLAYGFVPAGSAADQRLAKPRISKPGMQKWARAMAAQSGFKASLSPAGRHGDVLEAMLGSRSRLLDVVSSDLLSVLRSYVPRAKTTHEQFPGGEGCVIRDTVYLNFDGIVNLSKLSVEAAREQCDLLLAETILTRGLLLDCVMCGTLDFVSIGRLQQTNTCLRCGHASQLSVARWKQPHDEPHWFYDLHPVATSLMSQNGDVPLLLAAYLRSTVNHRNHYVDCSELEVSDLSGKKVAEADLLAYVDGSVVVAEAKSTDELDSGSNQKKAAKKRALLSEIFGADEIVLATTKNSWKPSSIEAINVAVEQHNWRNSRRPRIREIVGLGTAGASDRYID